MRADADTRQAVRDWICRTSGKLRADEIDDDTPIIERRIISSLQIMDLIVFLEELRGQPIDVESLQVGVFRNVNAIYENFLKAGSHAP